MPGGRGHPAFCSKGTDEPVVIIRGNIDVHDEHLGQIQETEDNRRKLKTKQEHRNRLKVIIQWLKDQYPQYTAAGGVISISQEHARNPNFFQHTNTEDLKYNEINVTLIKAFLSSAKRKSNGKICSFSNIRKFHDSILFGAEQASEVLPQIYHQEIQTFLESFKKESVKAKRQGNVDEHDADQIPLPLYSHICEWTVAAGNIFVWAFTLCQWNCMG